MTRHRNPLYERIAELSAGESVTLTQGRDFPPDDDPEFRRSNIMNAMRYRGHTCHSIVRDKTIVITMVSKGQQ